ncbi:phage terminase small subunit [Mycobacterium sp.]|uniref:phage terminase small subunit n=1 Tax=Mycobacterium sp. TaxID=1785 RepID=UPI003F9C6EF1
MSPGPAPKPAGKRIRKTTRSLGVVSVAGKRAPRMPAGLSAEVQAAWQAFWTSPVSGAMTPADTVVAIRWAKNSARRLKLIAEADREPLVSGSQGQSRPNPLYRLAMLLEASIRADEQQMGVGPLNRLRLGLALSESSRSLADLNIEVQESDDPRAALTVVAD